ncbi:hypothetical protein [Pannonibacter indicus]|uniref:Uncharacterized protein n=1 Tax=Pannonibacter indicus TaxID=466044 RepID=A0A0K6HRY7_9HYPH|nr:hypothetical protein [Pannonibacter indicus]CUA93553.1 hypothetical protein Ga0061067_102426 [Pannonibacter indicus]
MIIETTPRKTKRLAGIGRIFSGHEPQAAAPHKDHNGPGAFEFYLTAMFAGGLTGR